MVDARNIEFSGKAGKRSALTCGPLLAGDGLGRGGWQALLECQKFMGQLLGNSVILPVSWITCSMCSTGWRASLYKLIADAVPIRDP